MINLVLFVLFVFFVGYSFICIFPVKLTMLELISFLFPVGSILLTLFCWTLSILKIHYTFSTIYIPLLLISVVFFIFKLFFASKKSLVFFSSEREFVGGKLGTIVYFFVFAFILIEILAIFSQSISTKVYQPDEYSQWAFQAKMIFEGKDLKSFYGGPGFETGFETYPSFIPLLAASFYFFSGSVIDSFVRAIGPIFLSSLLLFLYTRLVVITKSKVISICLIAIMISSGFVIFEMSTGLYADIEYSYFYSISSLLFISHLVDKENRSSLLYSAAFLGMASWVKTDGQYMTIFHIMLLIFVYLNDKRFEVNTNKIKNVILFSIISLIIPFLWKIYTYANNFPVSRWGSFELNLGYTFSMISSSIQQIMNTTNWGMFWLLVFSMIVVNMYLGWYNNQIYLIVIIISNVIFLYVSYLLLFGAEALTAASFSRYMLRTAPIALVYVGTVISLTLNIKLTREGGLK
jgi:hypothetical protein